uniref:Costars domain-containing protein n=1 Tax=Trichuris muris TaxID=70415 RepID=A0A5S6QB16_TRIMR
MELIYRRIYGARITVLHVDVAGGGNRDLPTISIRDCMEHMKQQLGNDLHWNESSTSTTSVSKPPLRHISKARSTMSASLAKFQQMSDEAAKANVNDVFSPNWTPPKFDRSAPDYGRPKHGSLTEKRGIAAGNHISREIIQLCELINEFGDPQPDGTVIITFGKLFDIYTYVSDKECPQRVQSNVRLTSTTFQVVGMLLRARRHKIVDFAGEMLYQRQDENVKITMLLPIDKVRLLYTQSNDPALCLQH